jgi:hypothetical protein
MKGLPPRVPENQQSKSGLDGKSPNTKRFIDTYTNTANLINRFDVNEKLRSFKVEFPRANHISMN